MEKIHIFYSSLLTSWGGGAQSSFQLANLLSKNGYRVTLSCYPAESEAKFGSSRYTGKHDLRYKLVCEKLFRYEILGVSKISLTKKTSLIDYLGGELGGYDLYIVNGINPRSLLPLTLYKIFGKHPCVFRFNFRSLLYPGYAVGRAKVLHYLYNCLHLPQFIKASDAIWVLSETDEIYFRKLGKKVYKIINCVDLDHFQPRDKLERFTVLFVGRFTYEKSLETLFRSIDLVNRSGIDPDFVFIGSGDDRYERQLENLTAIHRNVHWEKPLFDRELADYYAKSHVTVVPSILEGLPNVALESLSSGTPVISSSIPGLEDIIIPRSDDSENCTGALFPAKDALALTNEIVTWYQLWKEKPSYYQRICENARNYATRNLNENRFLDEIRTMIKEMSQAR